MSEKITGYTETTPQSLTTGAGVIFKNFDLATDTVASAKNKIISATSGGVTVGIELDSWYREIDGLPENTKGMFEVEAIKPTVKATLAEVNNVNVLASALGAAAVSTPEHPDSYQLVQPKAVEDADYLSNITVVTQTKQGEPLIIQILNPISTEGFELSTEYKAGGGMEVTYTGMYDPLNVNDAPVKFYVPTPAGE